MPLEHIPLTPRGGPPPSTRCDQRAAWLQRNPRRVALVTALLMVGAAASLSLGQEAGDVPKQPLTVEIIPTTVTLERADPAELFIVLTNGGQTAVTNVQLRLHMPIALTQIEEAWDHGTFRDAGTAAHAVLDLEPFGQRVTRVRLYHRGAWTAVKAATVIVDVAYRWTPKTGGSGVDARALRSVTVKVGALESLSVFGVPLALAIFIVPGLLAISLFNASLVSSIRWIDDNKLFISFLSSVLLILFWNGFLRFRFGAGDLWTGVSVEALFGFTVVAGAIGLAIGRAVRHHQRTSAEKWPVRFGLPLETIVANLAQRRSLPTSSSIIQRKDGLVLSALVAESDLPGEIVLLPRRYRLTGSDALTSEFSRALAGKAPGRKFAKLLRSNPGALNVADGIQQYDEQGHRHPYPHGDAPIWIPREGAALTREEGYIFRFTAKLDEGRL